MRIADWQGRRLTPSELKARTKTFALGVIDLTEGFPRTRAADVVGRQLLRAATSAAANYRSACRARSRRDFIAKMGIVEEEADDAQFWMEIAAQRGLASGPTIAGLRQETSELVGIAVAAIRTARGAGRANPQSAIRNPQCS